MCQRAALYSDIGCLEKAQQVCFELLHHVFDNVNTTCCQYRIDLVQAFSTNAPSFVSHDEFQIDKILSRIHYVRILDEAE